MPRLGLALSGGGLRATLFHLGVVRFLRDAGLLGEVTHIVSVSGGSILGAHLALNWGRYNGSAADFEEAASKIVAFVQSDARNQIARRIPFLVPLRSSGDSHSAGRAGPSRRRGCSRGCMRSISMATLACISFRKRRSCTSSPRT